MISNKIYSFITAAVTCLVLLAAGCTQTAKLQSAILELRFTPQVSTTYKLMTKADKSVIWEGPLPEGSDIPIGGHTGNTIEITFAERIQSIDEQGNAIADITIKELKFLTKVRDKTILDFDSSREKDQDIALAKLIGNSYTIKISPVGRVLEVTNVNNAQASFEGSSSAHKIALSLLSTEAIKERHTLAAFVASDRKQLIPGDTWSDIKSFSFERMGSKTYEKIYTLKQIKNIGNRQVAIVEMNAIPSSEMAEELHKEQPTGFWSKMFDNIETYTGELKFDLTAGKVETYHEGLNIEWIMVDPNPKNGEEPSVIRMKAARSYKLEKID